MRENVISKVMVGGDGGVGKTTLLMKIIQDSFTENMKMTIGVDFKLYDRDYQKRHFTIQFWDLGGQEQFRAMLEGFCRGAQFGIIAYDLTRFSSVLGIENWVQILRSKCNIPLILIGTKADLVDQITVTDSDVQPYIEKYGFIGHQKISSKDGTGIEGVVMKTVKILNDALGPVKEATEKCLEASLFVLDA